MQKNEKTATRLDTGQAKRKEEPAQDSPPAPSTARKKRKSNTLYLREIFKPAGRVAKPFAVQKKSRGGRESKKRKKKRMPSPSFGGGKTGAKEEPT